MSNSVKSKSLNRQNPEIFVIYLKSEQELKNKNNEFNEVMPCTPLTKTRKPVILKPTLAVCSG